MVLPHQLIFHLEGDGYSKIHPDADSVGIFNDIHVMNYWYCTLHVKFLVPVLML